jgi:hypothetical protein
MKPDVTQRINLVWDSVELEVMVNGYDYIMIIQKQIVMQRRIYILKRIEPSLIVVCFDKRSLCWDTSYFTFCFRHQFHHYHEVYKDTLI